MTISIASTQFNQNDHIQGKSVAQIRIAAAYWRIAILAIVGLFLAGPTIGYCAPKTVKQKAAARIKALEEAEQKVKKQEKQDIAKFHIKPEEIFPARPQRTPVDLSDTLACYRELAELAGFSATYAWNDMRPNAVGEVGYNQLPDRIKQLDDAARFEHLLNSNNVEFKALVEKVRGVYLDSWRLNCANQEFGWTLKHVKRRETRAFAAGIAAVGSQIFDEAISPEGELHVYRGSDGVWKYYRDPAPAVEYSERTKEWERRWLQLLQNDDGKERLDFTKLLWSLRDCLEERMSDIWKQDLIKPLRESAGPTANDSLIVTGAPVKLAKGLLKSDSLYGRVAILNKNPAPLHHVTIAVMVQNEQGDKLSWFIYFPELPRSGPFVTQLSGSFGRHFDHFSERIDASYSIFCDEGKQEDVKVDFGPPPSMEDRKSRRDDVLASRERIVDLNQANLTQSADVFAFVNRRYPTPRNPEAFRGLLLSRVTPDKQYQVKTQVGDEFRTTTIEIRSIDVDSNAVSADLISESTKGVLRTPMVANVVEEPERGCVIAFMEILRPMIAEKDPKKVDQAMQKVTKEAVQGQREVAEGKRHFVTWPIDVPNIGRDELRSVIDAGLKPLSEREKVIRDLRERYSLVPDYVLYLDAKLNLALQSRPDSKGHAQFAVVTDAPKEAP